MSRYTIDELLALRESPLVKKPDELPSIEQWLDQSPQDQQQQQQPQREANQPNPRKAARNGNTSQNSQRDENNTPMGNFSQRPSLLQARHASRSSMTGSGMSHSDLSRVATNLVRTLQADGLLEDIVLGPPKTSFASSRNIKLASESADKLAPTSEDANEEDGPPSTTARSRFLQDRNAPAPTTARSTSGLKSDREAWRVARKSDDADEERNGDRERLHGRRDRNTDSQDERRSGYGARSEQRWSRDGDGKPMSRLGEGQRGGWRDRERAKQENHYGRDTHNERDPEWMDEPAPKDDGMPQMKTVEDFEKWKESMKRKNQPRTTEAKDDVASPEVMATPIKSAQTSTTPATPVVQDSGFNKLFGTWGQSAPMESPVAEAAPKQPKAPNTAKSKSSRFASMFAPKDEQRELEQPASPSMFKQTGNGSSEDKEGFARIMAMLGKPTLGGDEFSRDASSPAQAGGLGALFGAAPQPPQQQQHHNRPPSYPHSPDDAVASFTYKKPSSVRPESGVGGVEAYMSPHPPQDKPSHFPVPRNSNPASNVASPDPSRLSSDTGSQHQPRPQFPFLDHAPPHSSASSSSQLRHMQQTPESLSAQQNIAGERNQKAKGALNKDSEFLLNLISQAKNNNRSATSQNQQSSQQTQQGGQQIRPDDFQLFLDQPPQQQHTPQQQQQQQPPQLQRRTTQPPLETHAPKPQQPHRAPGQLEEQLFKSGIPQLINMPPHAERERMDQPQPRGQQQRVPLGFYDDPAIMLQQHQMQQQQQQQQQMQQAGRRASQAPLNNGQDRGQGQQVQQSLPEHMFQGPPPGFPLGPQLQQQQQQQQQARDAPGRDGREDRVDGRLPQPPPGFNPNMRHPPGFAGIPGIFQPPQQQQGSISGPPQQQPQVGRMRQGNESVEFGGLSHMGPGPMQGHGPGPQLPLQGLNGHGGPQLMPQGLPQLQGPQGMGPPPPGFFNGIPPPGFFNGPPPPGFPGMGMPPGGGMPGGMVSPPGLMRGVGNNVGSPIEGPGQGLMSGMSHGMGPGGPMGMRSPIEGQGMGMGLPLGFGLPGQGPQRRQ